MTPPDALLARLRDLLAADEPLADLLARSLSQARSRAQVHLDPNLFAALEWPVDLDGYQDYLRRFARWIPRQSDAKAWRNQTPEGAGAKEVGDRLAHFFFLIDQNIGSRATVAENSGAFRDWLTDYASAWGEFLDTPDSFGPEILRSFVEDAPEYRVGDSMVDGRPNMPSGWLTFNQFFARELNAGLRPITEPDSNLVVTSPADCFYQATYGIDDESRIPATRIKSTHTYGTITTLIEGSRHAERFAGGTFAHYMLPPSAYHRFHFPVSGRLDEAFVVQGTVYMQVDLADGELASRDSATTGYEFSQTRGVVTVDTSGSPAGDLGVVGVVPVGMSHVASVVLTGVTGTQVAKGEEFGYFQFGGSDIILLFEPGADPQLDTDPGFRPVGSVAGRVRP